MRFLRKSSPMAAISILSNLMSSPSCDSFPGSGVMSFPSPNRALPTCRMSVGWVSSYSGSLNVMGLCGFVCGWFTSILKVKRALGPLVNCLVQNVFRSLWSVWTTALSGSSISESTVAGIISSSSLAETIKQPAVSVGRKIQLKMFFLWHLMLHSNTCL